MGIQEEVFVGFAEEGRKKMAGQHWLLWDGDCGLCRRAAAWVKRKDLQEVFVIVPYQDALTPPMTPDLREACKRAVHVVTDDGTLIRAGKATLFILEQIG